MRIRLRALARTRTVPEAMKSLLSTKMPKGELFLFLFSFLTALLTALPGLLYRNSLDWDEDVFQYVTQRIVFHHELPYVTTFENKPPLAYFAYFIPVLLQPEDKLILRSFASTLLAIIAYSIAHIFLSDVRNRTKIVYILTFMITYRFYPGGLTWLTELNGTLILVLLMYLIANTLRKESNLLYFTIGVVSSCAILTRTNLIFPVVFLALLLLASSRNRSNFRWPKVFSYIIGFVMPFIFLILFYLVLGQIQELYKGLLQLPIAITGSGSQIQFGVRRIFIYFLGLFLSLYLLRSTSNSESSDSKFKARILVFTHTGLLLSIIFNLPNFGHHLLQIVPTTLAMLFLAFRNSISGHSILSKVLMLSLFIGFFVVSITQQTPRPNSTIWKKENNLVNQLKSAGMKVGDTLWSTHYNFLYSRFQTTPISSIFIHPANIYNQRIISIWKGAEYSHQKVIYELLQDSPEWLVFNTGSADLEFFLRSPFFQSYELKRGFDAKSVLVFELRQ